jgi:hypothetical protein
MVFFLPVRIYIHLKMVGEHKVRPSQFDDFDATRYE